MSERFSKSGNNGCIIRRGNLYPTLFRKHEKDGAPTSPAVERFIEFEDIQSPEIWQFWQRRFYDFNVRTRRKHIEKLKYIHRNPVVRGLTARPEDWPWSSYRHYATGEVETVEIESPTGAWKRRQADAHSSTSRPFPA